MLGIVLWGCLAHALSPRVEKVLRAGDREEAGEDFSMKQFKVQDKENRVLLKDPTPTDDNSLVIRLPYIGEGEYNGYPRFVSVAKCACLTKQKTISLPTTADIILQGLPQDKVTAVPASSGSSNMHVGALEKKLETNIKLCLDQQQKIMFQAVSRIRTLQHLGLQLVADPTTPIQIPNYAGGCPCETTSSASIKAPEVNAATPANVTNVWLASMISSNPALSSILNASNADANNATATASVSKAEQIRRNMIAALISILSQMRDIERTALSQIADLRLKSLFERDQIVEMDKKLQLQTTRASG